MAAVVRWGNRGQHGDTADDDSKPLLVFPQCCAQVANGGVGRHREFTHRYVDVAKDVGQGAYEGNREGGFQFKLFHGLTPETETSCYYYFATATAFKQDDRAAQEQFFRDSREKAAMLDVITFCVNRGH